MTTMDAVLTIPTLRPLPPGERAAEFFERRGRRVFAGAGSWWASIDAGSRSFLNCSEHLVLPAATGEVSAALGRNNAIAAQYASNDPGAESGVYLLSDAAYDMEHVQKRMRNFVRKGQKHFEIRPVEKQELLERGLAINNETMTRHQVFREEFADPKLWRRNADAVYGMDGTICMGAFEQGVLMGYVFGVIDDGVAFLMVQKTVDAALEMHANPALMFETCRALFATGQVRAISLGTVPFMNSPNLHHFKTRIGFEVHPYQMRIQLHPALEPFANRRLLEVLATHGGKLPKIGDRIERHAKLLQLGRGYVRPEAPPVEVEHAGV